MLSRRQIFSVLGAVPAAGVLTPGSLYAQAVKRFPQRLLGRTGQMQTDPHSRNRIAGF